VFTGTGEVKRAFNRSPKKDSTGAKPGRDAKRDYNRSQRGRKKGSAKQAKSRPYIQTEVSSLRKM